MITAAHSKLGASSYERYKNCPGSIRESEGIEKTESEYAKDGSFAHGVAEKMLKGERMRVGKTVTVAINGVDETRVLDEETLEAVTVYVDFVMNYNKPEWLHFIERKFDLTKYHPGLFGTADAVLYHPATKKLIVVDYKHGQGVAVEIEKEDRPNPQLMFYGLGALHDLNLPVREVELAIIQPRCYHVDGPIRSKRVLPMELLDFSFELIDDAKATEAPDAPLKSGYHCKFCPAAHKCPELKAKAMVMVKSPFSELAPPEAGRLGEMLDQLPAIEGFVKAVREFAYREAINGRLPSGYKLVDKRANRRWSDEEKAHTTIYRKTKLKHSDLFTEKIKSPAQVEKLLERKEFAMLSDLIVSESSGQTLVHDTDKRKEVITGGSPFDVLT